MNVITVYSDYVCPYCLLAEQVLSNLIKDRDIRITWKAFELRPEPVPTLKVEDPYLPTIWRESVYPLAEKLGVPIKLPSISPQSRTQKASELLLLAQDKGLDHPYSMGVLRAFFQEDLDIGDIDVLVKIATEVGIDSAEARQVLKDGTYAARHREAQRYAQEEMAIQSVPTIVVGKKIFRGTPSSNELELALKQLEEENADSNTSIQQSSQS